tara:strand:+ start:8982 stop:10766 length:1785 start_codon:yes stop_codon:yes gene_type:complete
MDETSENIWIKNVVSTIMFGVTGAYFAANLDATTFLHADVAHLLNCFGAALSFMCLLMTFFSAIAHTDLLKLCFNDTDSTPKLDTNFAGLWSAMEQKIRDTSLLVLFSIVGIGAGMSTDNTFAVVAVVSIFLGRQTAKYFDMPVDDPSKADPKTVTWVQNGLACILFVTAFVAGILKTKADLVDYIVVIAAVVQLILVISKRFSPDHNHRRMLFEETVCSLYHFVVLGSLLSRVDAHHNDDSHPNDDSQSLLLISIAAVVVADFSARFQKYEPDNFHDGEKLNNEGFMVKIPGVPGSAVKLLVTRVALLATSATAAVASVLLFDQATGKEEQIAALAMVASVLKTLNCLSFLLDSRTESYKSVYNFISNGCTSLLLLTVSVLLGMNRSDPNGPKGLTVVLLCAAIVARITDMVQNAYASPHPEDTKLYKSSIDDEVSIDAAGITNFRAIVVFILLVVGTATSYVGAAEICPEFISISNHTNVTVTLDGVHDYCGSAEDVNLLLSYFSIMTGHTCLALVAFIVAAAVPEKSPVHFVALSTVEIPRVLVSTTIIVLGGLVLGIDIPTDVAPVPTNTVLSMSYVVYALADGLGMSLM